VERFVVPSQHMLQALVTRGFTQPEKIRQVRLGVDLSKLTSESASRGNDFLFVGRLMRYKNPQFPIELLSRDHLDPKVSFRILGAGPDGVLRSLANLPESQKRRVHVLGHRPREAIFDELSRARGLIIPSSIPENSPLVAYEALASGTPVLCSDLGGTRELVRESKAGEILSVQDLPSWERAINALMDGRFWEVSRRASNFGRDSLGIAKSADGVMAVYNEIAA